MRKKNLVTGVVIGFLISLVINTVIYIMTGVSFFSYLLQLSILGIILGMIISELRYKKLGKDAELDEDQRKKLFTLRLKPKFGLTSSQNAVNPCNFANILKTPLAV